MMTGPSRFARPVAALALAFVWVLGLATPSRAQGDLEKTPWATSMVYPVGDPADFQRPAPGDQHGFSLSRGLQAGSRHHERHEGLDLANHETGSEVRAVAPGLVVCTRSHAHGWGNMVVLAHRLPGGDVLFSLFAHLLPGSISVHEGELVALGQPLAKVGRTGHATGPHLHLEFRTLTASLEAIRHPFAVAWERASVVDPLRVFASMRTGSQDDRTGPTAPLGSAIGTALAPPLGGAVDDPFAEAVAAGRLPDVARQHDEDALTRGELYRLAYAEIAPSGRAIPNRWSALRSMLLARASSLPKGARAAFDPDVLPRSTSDADRPVSLAEFFAVRSALDLARGDAARGDGPDVARPDAAAPARADLEAEFAFGLRAWADADRAATVLPLPSGFVGPPAVSRRQACMLFAWAHAGKGAGDDMAGAEER